MRLLESANKVQSDTILNYTRDLFSASEFLYKGPEQVQIITGKDEGINAWISTNYYLNNFNTVKRILYNSVYSNFNIKFLINKENQPFINRRNLGSWWRFV